MVVNLLKNKTLIIPLIFGILFSVLYFKLPLKYFTILFLGFIVVIGTLHDIRFGIFLSVFALPYLPEIASLIFMLFIIIAFLYEQNFKKDYKEIVLTKHPIDIPIVLYVLIIIISTITSLNPIGSFRDLSLHLVSIGFAFVVINSIKNKKDLNKVLVVMVITATLTSIWGLIQYKFGVGMEEGWVDKANNPDLMARVFSVFGNPNIFAEYLIMIIPISLALFWNTRYFFKKVLFLLFTVLLIIALLLTYSRGGWVGLVFGVFIFILLMEKRLLFLIIPLGILSINLLPPPILKRLESIASLTDSSNFSRINIWKVALDIIHENWMAGVGFGYIPFKQVFDTKTMMGVLHSHNTYLEVLAEMGIGGFIVFLLLIVSIYKWGIKEFSKQEDRYVKTMLAGVLASISALLIHGLADNILYMPRIIITFWTMVSFVLVLVRISNGNNETI